MPTIDQRVVQMQFDNKQFEQGVAQSLGSLEALKKALNLENSSKGLESMQKSLNNFDVSGVTKNIDSIASHFTVVGRFIDRHVDQILDKMTNGVKNFAKSLTVDQVRSGMSKYEQYNQSVQMIQSAMPEKSIAEIEAVLGKLNEYTDLTSYSFSEMANSIGKFVSSGVDLETSEIAMEGIANWAASAGGNVREANIAMYNLSQALSAGSVKVMDWKSIELANMATKEFKEQVIQAAISLGVLKDAGNNTGYYLKQTKKGVEQNIVTFENFRQTLSDGWFNSDVLLTVLSKYADRTDEEVGKKAFEMAKIAITWTQAVDAIKDAISTGWMNSFRIIIGDLDEAGKLFTRVSDAIIDFAMGIADWRNEVLTAWKTAGGYNATIEAAANIWHIFLDVVDLVRNALATVIPPITGEGIADLSKKIEHVTGVARGFFDLISGNTGEDGETDIKVEADLPEEEILSFSGVLKRGMSGDEVKDLQERLIQLGYTLGDFGADGKFGKYTENALKQFQSDQGLKPDGIFGDFTWRRIHKMMGETVRYAQGTLSEPYNIEPMTKTLKLGDVGDDVAALQKRLIDLGYTTEEDLKTIGSFGPKTQAALKALQKDTGIVENGIFNPQTWNELRKLAGPSSLNISPKILKLGDTGDAVAELQNELIRLGYATEDDFDKIGVYGEKTEQVVKNLKKELKPGPYAYSGVFDIKTWQQLNDKVTRFNNIKEAASEPTVALENFTKMLERGAKGDEVKTLQQHLIDLGYLTDKSMADGIYGPQTEAAVKKFQKDMGIEAHGKYGYDTYYAIKESLYGMNEQMDETIDKTPVMTKVQQNMSNILAGVGAVIRNIITVACHARETAVAAIGQVWGMITPFIGVVVDLAGTFLGLIKNWDISGKSAAFFSNIIKKITKFLKPFGDRINKVTKRFRDFADRAKSFKTVSEFWSELRKELEKDDFWKNVFKIFDSIKTAVDTAKPAIIDFYNKAKTYLWDKLQTVFSWVSTNASAAFDKIANAFSTVINYVKENNVINKVLDGLLGILKVIGGIAGIAGLGIFKLVETIANGAVAMWNFLTTSEKVKNVWEKIKNFFSPVTNFFSTIGESMDELTKSGKKLTISNVLDSVTDKLSNGKEIAAAKFAAGISKIVSIITLFGDSIAELKKNGAKINIGNLLTMSLGKLKSEGDPKKNGIAETIQYILDKYNALKEWIDTKLVPIGNKIKAFFSPVVTFISAMVNSISNLSKEGKKITFMSVLSDMIGDLFLSEDPEKNKLALTLLGLVEKFESIGRWIRTTKGRIVSFFSDIYEKIKAPDDVTNPIERIKIAFENLIEFIKTKFGPAFNAVKNFFTFDKNLTFGENIQAKLDIVGKAIGDFANTIKNKFIEIYENSPLLQSAFEKIKTFVTPIISKFKSFIDVIKQLASGDFSSVEGVLNRLGEAFSWLWEMILNGGKSAKEGIKNIKLPFDAIVKTVKGFKIPPLTKFILPMLGVVGLGRIIYNLIAGFKRFGDTLFLKSGGKIDTMGDTILKFAKAIAIIAVAVGALSLLDEHKVRSTVWSITLLVGGLATITLLLSKLNKGSNIGNSVLGVALSVAAIAGALWLMTSLLEKYKGDMTVIWEALGLIALMVIGLAGVQIALSNFGGNNSGGKIGPIIGLAAGVLILCASLFAVTYLVDKYGGDDVVGAWGMVEGLVVTFGLAIAAINQTSKDVNIGNAIGNCLEMITFAATFQSFILDIAVLTILIDKYGEAADKAFGMVEAVMITFGLALVAINDAAPKLWTAIGVSGEILSLGHSISEIATSFSDAIVAIKDVDLDVMKEFFKDVGLFTGGTFVASGIIGKFPEVFAIGAGLLAAGIEIIGTIAADVINKFSNAMAILGMRIWTFNNDTKDVSWDLFDKAATAIGKICGLINSEALSSAASAYKTVQNFSATAMKLGTSIKTFNTRMTEISGNNSIGGAPTVIGKIIGSIISLGKADFSSAVSKANELESIGAKLGLYYDSLKGVDFESGGATPEQIQAAFTGLKNGMPDDSTISSVGAYAEGSSKSGDLEAFAEGIRLLGTAIKSYGENVGTLNPFQMMVANSVIKNISGLQSDLKINGFFELAGAILGKNQTLTQFATDVEDLGSALGDYGSSIGTLDKDQVKLASGIIQELSNVELNKQGGILSWVTGEKSLSNFATNIGDVGVGIKNYADATSGANFKNVDSAKKVFDSVGSMLNKVGKYGGLQSFLMGENSISQAFTNLGQVGTAISDFIENSKDVKEGDGKAALSVLSEMLDEINKIQWSTSTVNGNTLSSIAIDAVNALDTLANYKYDWKNRNVDHKNVWKNSMEDAVSIANQIKSAFSVNLSDTANSPTSNIGTMIDSMVTAITDSGNRFSEAAKSIVTSIISGVKDNSDDAKFRMSILMSAMKQAGKTFIQNGTFKGVGTDIVSSIIAGIQESTETVKLRINILMSAMKQAGRNFIQNGSFKGLGTSICSAISSGIKESDAPRTAIVKVITGLVKQIRNTERRFVDVAAWIDHGLAQGIRDNVWRVEDAVTAVANAAITRFCQESVIRSPSRVFAWAGQMLDMGIVKGLESYSSLVGDASASVADEAIDSVKEGLGAYSNNLVQDLDATPTIRPVLDLSEVESGLPLINGLFGGQTIGVRSAGLAGTINRRDEEIAEARVNASEIGLASSIQSLNDRVNELGERISNLKVYMNGSALVGQILPDVDRGLGRIKVRR